MAHLLNDAERRYPSRNAYKSDSAYYRATYVFALQEAWHHVAIRSSCWLAFRSCGYFPLNVEIPLRAEGLVREYHPIEGLYNATAEWTAGGNVLIASKKYFLQVFRKEQQQAYELMVDQYHSARRGISKQARAHGETNIRAFVPAADASAIPYYPPSCIREMFCRSKDIGMSLMPLGAFLYSIANTWTLCEIDGRVTDAGYGPVVRNPPCILGRPRSRENPFFAHILLNRPQRSDLQW